MYLKFLPHLQGHHIQLKSDTMVATSYIHRQGGLGSPRLCKLTHVPGVGTSVHLMSLKL